MKEPEIIGEGYVASHWLICMDDLKEFLEAYMNKTFSADTVAKVEGEIDSKGQITLKFGLTMRKIPKSEAS